MDGLAHLLRATAGGGLRAGRMAAAPPPTAGRPTLPPPLREASPPPTPGGGRRPPSITNGAITPRVGQSHPAWPRNGAIGLDRKEFYIFHLYLCNDCMYYGRLPPPQGPQ